MTSDELSVKEAMRATPNEVEMCRRSIMRELKTLEEKGAWKRESEMSSKHSRYKSKS